MAEMSAIKSSQSISINSGHLQHHNMSFKWTLHFCPGLCFIATYLSCNDHFVSENTVLCNEASVLRARVMDKKLFAFMTSDSKYFQMISKHRQW